MSSIETVIFDVGGVLHKINPAMMDDLVNELGIDQETLESIWANQLPLLGSGKINEAEFWSQLSSEYGLRKADVSENILGRNYVEKLELNTKVLEFVKELGLKGISLAILSNTIEPHARALKAAGVYDGFDRLFLSHEIGMRKPDLAIFEHTLNALDVSPESTLLVDDDPVNIKAAESLGMHGTVFRNEEQAIADIRALIEAHSNPV